MRLKDRGGKDQITIHLNLPSLCIILKPCPTEKKKDTSARYNIVYFSHPGYKAGKGSHLFSYKGSAMKIT
jgi:hypothetical protein